MDALLDDDVFELQLQTCLLLCHAIDSKDFKASLSSVAHLHNLSVEYAHCKAIISNRVKCTVFFTSDAARPQDKTTVWTGDIQQPTAYVVLGQPEAPQDSWLSDFSCSCHETHGEWPNPQHEPPVFGASCLLLANPC